MSRLPTALLLLFTVLGCSVPSSKTINTRNFEDSFRCKPETRKSILDNARIFISSTKALGDFVWDDHFINSAALVSPDGKWLLTGQRSFADTGFICSNRGIVSLWSLIDPKAHQPNIIPEDNRSAVVDWMAFTADTSQFFVFRRPIGNYKPGTLKRYDLRTGKELQTISSSLAAQTGAVSPDGQRLVAVTLNSLEIWNVLDGQKFGSIPLDETVGVDAIRFTADGRLLFVGCNSNKIKVFDLHVGRQIISIPIENSEATENKNGEQWKNCFAVSPDGKTLLIIDSQQHSKETPNGCFRFIEIGSWRILRELKPTSYEKVTHKIQTVCFSPEGNKLYGIGFRRTESNETEIKSFLGEFDLNLENRDWTDIPYEAIPLHPIGKRLLMYPDSGGIVLTLINEKASIDFNLRLK